MSPSEDDLDDQNPPGLDFLSGGGEMGRLMRAHDWSGSALGPPATWPLPLRTVVHLLLNTGHPMYIWWGEAGSCLYNDAYALSIGPERHPGSLGRPAREVWGEIWHIIGPQIDQVMSGRGATWHENQLVPITRNGHLEDVYWTYSFCPIAQIEAPNGVGGVLVVCTETTQQVVTEQRIATQAERQRRLFQQAPGFICILGGPDHVFEFVNQAYIRLLGQRDFIGRAVRDVVPDVEGQNFFELLDQVYRTGEPYVASDVLIRLRRSPDEAEVERYLNFIYQPVVDEKGVVTGIFVEGHDVTDAFLGRETERRQARHLSLLVDELNHRVKNTLAIVQGLAQQTFKGAGTTEEARRAFEGRLVALASAHNILTRESWESADLRTVVMDSLDALSVGSHRLELDGPPVPLPPKTAVMIAMALHELATNARKYGALANEVGRVSVTWKVTREPEGRLSIRWVESDGPVVRPPDRRGFGSRMIERALASELRGDVVLSFPPEGLVCEIDAEMPRLDSMDHLKTFGGFGR